MLLHLDEKKNLLKQKRMKMKERAIFVMTDTIAKDR